MTRNGLDRSSESNFVTGRAIMRDNKVYPNPDVFYPERFMAEVGDDGARRRDPRQYVFGFGRRYAFNCRSHRFEAFNLNLVLDDARVLP